MQSTLWIEAGIMAMALQASFGTWEDQIPMYSGGLQHIFMFRLYNKSTHNPYHLC
jgi:hypothetical protein